MKGLVFGAGLLVTGPYGIAIVALFEYFGGPATGPGLDPAIFKSPVFNEVGTDASIPVLYGFARVENPIVVYRDAGPSAPINIGGTFQTLNAGMVYIIAVACEGEIEAFDATYLDGVNILDARFAAGIVTVEYHTGTDAQATSPMLLAAFPTKWTANDTGAGIAYAVLALQTNTIAFPGREPKISFDIRGKKVFDPRDAGTRFSPNSALCIRDFATNTRYGRNVAAAKIDDAKISTEADYFEERIALPANALVFSADPAGDTLTFSVDGAGVAITAAPFDNGDGVQLSTPGALPGGTAAATTYYWIKTGPLIGKLATTYANSLARTAIDLTTAGIGVLTCTHIDQPRYTCNGSLDPGANPFSNFSDLVSSCRSWFFEAGGMYHLIADKIRAPSFDLTLDNIVGRWSFDLGDPRAHFNRVEGHFHNGALHYQPDMAPSDSTAERTADGERLLTGRIKLAMTTNFYMAQRLAQLERSASRLGARVGCNVIIQGFKAFCGDVGRITHTTPGWVNKLFRLARIDPGSDDELRVELLEYADSVYTTGVQAATLIPPRTNLTGLFNTVVQVPPMVSGLEVFNQGNPA